MARAWEREVKEQVEEEAFFYVSFLKKEDERMFSEK